jgi:Protein of unknown function (DUF1559)
MAATASFKQQCPSCEAWVPIRDPNLIGKKIDCPKCKYRFVVEDPGTDAADDEQAETEQEKKPRRQDQGNGKGGAVKGKAGPRRRDGDDEEGPTGGKRRKEGGGSTKLILGVVLGVVAVGILVAVAIFMLMGESPKSQPPSLAVNRPAPPPSAPAAEQPAAEPAAEEGEKPAPTPAPAAAAVPVSMEALTNLLPPDTEGTCNVRMKDLIRTSLGRTIFGTPGAFRSEAIQQRLGLAVEDIDLLLQAWNFTQNWSFNVIHTIRPINQNAIKAALRARPAPEGRIEDQEYFVLDANPWLDSLGNITFATLLQINPTQVPAHSGGRALRFFDDQTLLLADLAPMKQFLSVKGHFPPKQQPKEAPKDAENPPAETGRPGAGIVPRGRGAPPAAEPPAAETEGAAPASSGAYLTINPNLKTMLDLVERKQPVVSLAADTQAARRHIPSLGLRTLAAALNAAAISKLALKTILDEAGVFGAALQLKDGLALALAEDCQSEDAARKRYTSIRRETGPELAKLLTAALGTKVDLLEEEQSNPDNPFGGGQTASPAVPGGRGFVPGAGRPGVLGPSGPVRPPIGPAYGMPGLNLPTQTPPEQERPKPPGSTIKVEVPDKSIVLLTIAVTDQEVNRGLMHGTIRQLVLQQKGYLDMAGGQLRIHDLGDAARRYVEANQATFPRGTVERPIPSTRAGRPYEPKQRLSWLAELLPFLGPEQSYLYRGIDRTKSWNDAENLGAAATLVPQFLNPSYGANTWWIHYPTLAQPVAATHYVGIAGIGADAAEYSANDAATAKKRGIFGYDRTTRLQDITDGVSNTIMMAQVPPTHKRPWLAGGGSTVEGVLEKDSIRPFVSPQPDGKRGTLVVMADGSVRFISDNISDDVFKALCTIQGGETGVIIDRDAPPVPRPEVSTEPPPPAVPPPSQPTVAAPSTGEWKEITSQEGGFTVSFPSTPREMKHSQDTPFGKLEIFALTAELPRNEGSYAVMYLSLPEAIAKQQGGTELILETIPQHLKASNAAAKIIGQPKKITQDGHPGRELTLEIPRQGIALVRVYMVKDHMYQVIVGGSKDFISSKDAQRFLDSFHVGEK